MPQTEINKALSSFKNTAGTVPLLLRTAFLSIIKSHSLYLADTRHAGDYLEKKWLVVKVLAEVIKSCKDKSLQDRLRSLHHFTTLETDNSSLFITSFSAQRDLLSQWRGYAADGGGFAIGLNTAKLNAAVGLPDKHNAGLCLAPAVYEFEKQYALVKNVVDAYTARKNTSGWTDEDYRDTELLRKLSLICKNPAFKEEAEWRLLHTPAIDNDLSHNSQYKLGFRDTGNAISPYFDWEFDKTAISHILIGPANRTSVSDVRWLLKDAGYPDAVKVEKSCASYAK